MSYGNEVLTVRLERLAELYATDAETGYYDHIRYTHYLAGLKAMFQLVVGTDGAIRAITEVAE
jgi:hypothetical protein